MLSDQVAATIFRYNMLTPGAPVGVAVSGGADSVCLLHVLRRMGWPVHVLHVNHGLRGAESEADERFVAELAAGMGVPFESVRGRLAPGNLEAVARAVRLEFFQAARVRLGLAAVATGHTRSDQAETVLFRAIRGSGLGGLAGILPVTAEGLVRPLLEVRREEVRAWLAAEGLTWREDSSNGERRFARNRLRGEALPLLESILPQASDALARLAEIALEEEKYWLGEVVKAWRPVREEPGVVIVDAFLIGGMAPALARRAVRFGLEKVIGRCSGLTYEHVERVLELARRAEGRGKVTVSRGEVWRSFGLLRIARTDDCEGAVTSREVIVEESAYNEGSHQVDAEKAPRPWVYRFWQPGDCYQPVGAVRSMKLKELFDRARVPSWDRRNWPMVVSEDRIVWSRRFGVAQWAMAGPKSRHIVTVREEGE